MRHGLAPRPFPGTVLLRLPVEPSASPLRFQHCSVSGFPLPCLTRCIPYGPASHSQEPRGPPTCFDASLPACHGLWTPADLPILAHADVLVLPSVCVTTLGVRHTRISKRSQHFRGRGSPYGLQDTLSTPRPSCSPCHHGPALDARLETGGWLALPRPGLSPGKRRQAYLGAGTPMLSGGAALPTTCAWTTGSRTRALPPVHCSMWLECPGG